MPLLMPLLVPRFLGLTPFRNAPRWRLAVPVAALIAALALDVPVLASLVRDFSAFQITPAW